MGNTLTVLVENNPGVLARVAGMFSRRGYNIDSLSVSTTDDPRISRMTIVVQGDEAVLQQVTRQLRKLVDVINVQDITKEPHVHRELILVKVNGDTTVRAEIMQIVEIFRARIIDVSQDSLIVEATGDAGKINAIEDALKHFGLREMVRTGKIALLRGGVTAVEYEEE
ncbi:MAG: acetolactate synthase small subunit [Eubacteriales bacterium]|nr:acetolactate synthase small subunit [Bacillota bacterium]MBV1727866.1 acetolactate synthase small subunit [Desulforudis sp.]MDQ7789882.1 acetolactate synthase small subunit [Clostridia bacterium]MDZ4043218.1 acetolactate synthase small subunit [Eubacteriales bacterium]MBU4533445.1 acetolactate synthase small subunit [Bacillota bacterium]